MAGRNGLFAVRKGWFCYACGVFGFLNINKPAGPTSHDVVLQVRRLIRRAGAGKRVKVGHAGTLDPFAHGVLLVCVGPATRLAEYVQRSPKRYQAEVTLAATSTTDDTEGQILPRKASTPPSGQQVREVLSKFVGLIEQVPPSHSAVHVNGERSYKLARSGVSPVLRPRQVRIESITLVSYAWPSLTIDVRCGSGTYLRALARDIGSRLGVGGYCSGLTRTSVGSFTIADAIGPNHVNLKTHLLSPLSALSELGRATVGRVSARRLANGNAVDLPAPMQDGEIAVLSEDGELLAIGQAVAGRFQPTKVFTAK